MSENAVIILKDTLYADAVARCIGETEQLVGHVLSLEDFVSPREFTPVDDDACIVLIELRGDSRENTRLFRRVRQRWPQCRSIIFSDTEDAREIAELFHLGAWGIFSPSDGIEVLRKAIRSVSGGELWTCRKNSSHIIRHLRRGNGGRGGTRNKSLLSNREKEVLALVAGGLKNRQIADRLCISEQTVKVHLNNIFKKIKVKDRLQAALFAIDKGLTPGSTVLKKQ